MPHEMFDSARPIEALRELAEALNYVVEEDEDGLSAKFEAPEKVGGAVLVRASAPKELDALRLTALALGAAVDRAFLSDALLFVNVWNANRPFPRAAVVNVEEKDRDLAFILDDNLKIDRPLSAEYARNWLGAFVSAALDFFNAVAKTFDSEFVESVGKE